MANLKNIAELPLAESADGLNLIVNDNGSAKQIATSAVGAQADWNETNEASPAFIVNKPRIHAAQVQSDWNQNDETKADYIKNRPFYDDTWMTVLHDVETQPQEGTTYAGQAYSLLNTESPTIFHQYPSGTTVRCVIDGEEYISQILGSEGCIGNFSLVNTATNTGDAFCIWTMSNGLYICVRNKPAAVYKVSVYVHQGGIHKLDSKYLPDEVVNRKPLILDATLSDYYGGHAEAGDEALEAIKTGRQILVKVPNASGDNYVASYSPIYMYQVPLDGMYLYMFYLRDEKQDLSALLGQPEGTVLMPTYGEFTMLLSKKHDSNPLEPTE